MYSHLKKPRRPACTAPRRGYVGFTLIELVVVIAIVGFLTSFAAPALRGFLVNQRVKTVAYELIADLTLARSEALKRGRAVTLSPSAVGDWTQGWVVASTTVVGTTTTAIELGKKPAVGFGVSFSPQTPSNITFDANGRLSGTTTVARFGISDGGSYQRCISLDPAGRPKTASTSYPI